MPTLDMQNVRLLTNRNKQKTTNLQKQTKTETSNVTCKHGVNNSRVVRKKNAKFSGYYFIYERQNIGKFSNLH